MACTGLLLCLLGLAAAGNYDPIILKGSTGADAKLVLFVPGGKVPIEDYVPLLQATMGAAETNLWAAIVHCGALNLCDPLGQLPGLIAKAVAAAGAARGAPFTATDTVVVGHSLGGVGARHYFDVQAAATAPDTTPLGLAILGTQYNGDHENFKGPLGFPVDLAAFPRPFLGLLGELDMLPISHAALLWRTHAALPDAASRALKTTRIIAGMDHSQFCAPFNVSGDIQPEIDNADATASAAQALGEWIDLAVAPHAAAHAARGAHADDHTAAISAGYLAAQDLEQSAWCATAQKLILAQTLTPEQIDTRLDIHVTTVNASTTLEHLHPSYTHGDDGVLHIAIGAYAYNAVNASSWNPVAEFAPTYSAATDIACKMLSADRIAEQLNITGKFPDQVPPVSCAQVNAAAADAALKLMAPWPAAQARASKRGRGFTFEKDDNTFAGPQWVFLSSLKFDEGKGSAPATVASAALYSSITSKIYPGNFYCKLLSPAKAVEWLQTKGIKGRFT